MFAVIAKSPLDRDWEYRDSLIYKAAGRRSDLSVASKEGREHTWYVHSADDAVAMKDRLNKVDDVDATWREPLAGEVGRG